MSLLEGTLVPGTRLRAKTDIPTMELLRVIGPALGHLYQELHAVDPQALDAQKRAQLEFLRRCFRVSNPNEKLYAEVREL